MARKSFDRPVINIHELVNGLDTYYNPKFDRLVLAKSKSRKRDSLTSIIGQLQSVDHYVTVNLAEYHIAQRQDSLEDQLNFYDFLNENFYVIGCRRDNLFEYAISWILKTFVHYGNTFYPLDKVVRYEQYYQDPITIDQLALEKFLNRYKAHIDWSEKYFDIQSHFDYDKHIGDIENFILNLDFMKGHANNAWEDMFEISWQDWNTCHRLLPNLVLNKNQETADTHLISLTSSSRLLEYTVADTLKIKDHCGTIQTTYQSNSVVDKIKSIRVTSDEYRFLEKNLTKYQNVQAEIEKLIQFGILSEGVPMKLQSLGEKQKIIKNFDQCLEWYNSWAIKNNFGKEYTLDDINTKAVAEEKRLAAPLSHQLPLV
jgi:hypothetical protein